MSPSDVWSSRKALGGGWAVYPYYLIVFGAVLMMLAYSAPYSSAGPYETV